MTLGAAVGAAALALSFTPLPSGPWLWVGAVGLGALSGVAAVAWPRRPSWEERVRAGRRRRAGPGGAPPSGQSKFARLGALGPDRALARLGEEIQRAGWATDPDELLGRLVASEGLLVVALAAAVDLGWLPPAPALALGLVPPAMSAAWLMRASARHRSLVMGEMPMLVDLMALEQSGGGVGARRAMELVVARTQGAATGILRDCLSRSASPGSPQLDRELERVAALLRLPVLAALAAVVRIQRQEGIAAGSPMGNLARGLRDRQRDQLTARGRRAMVSMLLPVAVCILLPFILIVLYPALARIAQVFS